MVNAAAVNATMVLLLCLKWMVICLIWRAVRSHRMWILFAVSLSFYGCCWCHNYWSSNGAAFAAADVDITADDDVPINADAVEAAILWCCCLYIVLLLHSFLPSFLWCLFCCRCFRRLTCRGCAVMSLRRCSEEGCGGHLSLRPIWLPPRGLFPVSDIVRC